MSHWTDADIPDQTGRVALVTGATGGLGLRVAEVLAARGARVLIGSRNPQRGTAALAKVEAAARAAPELVSLDLCDLTSVRAAATDIRRRTDDRLDLVINNGGIMAPPLVFSPDGFESQWATNVLGPAALTWLLLPALEPTKNSRVVFVSSSRHTSGRLDEARLRADVRGEQYRGEHYRGFDYYGRTKLADLLLSRELEQHFRRVGAETISVAAHPGFTSTGIVASGFGQIPRVFRPLVNWGGRAFGQSVEIGALPILRAATGVDARGDDFFGPRYGLRGYPVRAKRSAQAENGDLAAMLWRVVAELSGVSAPD